MRYFLLILLFMLSLTFFFYTVKADEYDDITHQLTDLKRNLESSQKATQTNEQSLKKLNDQLTAIKYKVSILDGEIKKKELEVKKGEETLAYQKSVLDKRTVSYYKNLNKQSFSVVNILVADNLSKSLETFFYNKTLIDQDRKTIEQIVSYIKDLQNKKTALQTESAKLAAIRAEVDKQSQFLAGEVDKSKKYENELQQQIAALSARQQQIIAQRQASLNIPQSAYTSQRGCSDDRGVDPGFSPRFALFSYGVPNRVGLSQYGAKGRAEAGQNVEDILNAYYANFNLDKGYNTGITIHVSGTNEYGQSFETDWNIEDYVKHVYEMPTDWPKEALKAQAIAARSFALAYTSNGSRSICPSQSCQVVKQEENSDAWKQAVDETKGWVMTSGGQPIKAWFSSTHGGYVYSSGSIGWSDTSWTKNAIDASGGVSSFGDLQNNAYDKGSPWFYCDWGARAEYGKTAWLKPEELADIANVLSLAKRDSSVGDHLYQPDKPNPAGQETWDAERVKSELRSRGGTPFNRITGGGVDWDKSSGRTTSVHFSGDAGDVTFDAGEFKGYFNVRAPGNIQIVGPLYNLEIK